MTDNCRKRLERLLFADADAHTAKSILKMFEAIKGRPAASTDIPQLRRKIPAARIAKP
jgi:hypothetical protein